MVDFGCLSLSQRDIFNLQTSISRDQQLKLSIECYQHRHKIHSPIQGWTTKVEQTEKGRERPSSFIMSLPEEDKDDDQWEPLEEHQQQDGDGAPQPQEMPSPHVVSEEMSSSPPPNDHDDLDDDAKKMEQDKEESFDAPPPEQVKRKSRVSFADSTTATSMTMADINDDIIDIEQPPSSQDKEQVEEGEEDDEEEPQVLQQTSKRRMAQRSTVLRKDVPVEFQLIIPELNNNDDAKSTDLTTASTHTPKHEYSGGYIWKLYQKLVLNVKYPLRRQMMLSFGSIGVLTIVLVMIVGILASYLTGEAIKTESSRNVDAWVDGFMGSTCRLVAEALGPKIMVSFL